MRQRVSEARGLINFWLKSLITAIYGQHKAEYDVSNASPFSEQYTGFTIS